MPLCVWQLCICLCCCGCCLASVCAFTYTFVVCVCMLMLCLCVHVCVCHAIACCNHACLLPSACVLCMCCMCVPFVVCVPCAVTTQVHVVISALSLPHLPTCLLTHTISMVPFFACMRVSSLCSYYLPAHTLPPLPSCPTPPTYTAPFYLACLLLLLLGSRKEVTTSDEPPPPFPTTTTFTTGFKFLSDYQSGFTPMIILINSVKHLYISFIRTDNKASSALTITVFGCRPRRSKIVDNRNLSAGIVLCSHQIQTSAFLFSTFEL